MVERRHLFRGMYMRRRDSVLPAISALLIALSPLHAWGGEEAIDGEMKLLSGEWERVSAVFADGREIQRVEGPYRLKITDGRWEKSIEGQVFGGTFTLNPSAAPRAIDFEFKGNDGGNRIILAIYRVDGDELTICSSPGERPTGLEVREGGRGVIEVYKRAKK